MPKVSIVVPSNDKGGAERVLINLANSISATDTMEVKLIVLSKGTKRGYPTAVSKIEWEGGFVRNMLVVLPKQLSHLTATDYVITSQFYLNVWVAFLKSIRVVKAKSIARESTRIFIRFSGWRRVTAKIGVWLFYRFHNLVIAQTTDMQNDLLEINRKVFTKVLLNPIGLATTIANKMPTNWGSKPTIMAAGRLVPIKKFDVLLEAFSKLDHSYELVIFGEGPERQRLLDIAENLQVANRFWLPGEVEEPRQFFGMAKACVVSSLLEGFPNVLLEMMSENGAVVSTLCADGIADLPGIVKCTPNDVSAMQQALRAALSLSELELQTNKDQMLEHLKSRSFQKYWENIVAYTS